MMLEKSGMIIGFEIDTKFDQIEHVDLLIYHIIFLLITLLVHRFYLLMRNYIIKPLF